MGDGVVLSIQAGTDKNQSIEEKSLVDICFLFLSAIQKTKRSQMFRCSCQSPMRIYSSIP
jgi:hypothetical protein